MMQLSIKSFWGARPTNKPAARKEEEENEEGAKAWEDATANAPASAEEPTPKRARFVAPAAKPPLPPPARRSSPRNQKKKDDKNSSPPATGDAATTASDEEEEEASRPPARARRAATAANNKAAAAAAKKKKSAAAATNKLKKDQQQAWRKKKAAAKTESKASDASDEDDDEDEDDDQEETPSSPGATNTATATASPADPPSASRGADGLTDYERQRAVQIARNRARLAALELPAMAASLAASVAAANPSSKANKKDGGPSQRGATAAKRRAREAAAAADSPPPPRRQSSRVRGLAAEAVGPLPEDRLVAAAAGGRKNIYGFVEAPQEARFDPAPVPLAAALNTGGGGADASFLRSLAARLGGGEPFVDNNSGNGSGSTAVPDLAALSRLRLADEEDVAKVTPLGVTAAALHPGELVQGRLLLAASDKKGVVALWDVEHGRRGEAAGPAAMEVDEEKEEEEGADGGKKKEEERAVRSGGGGSGSEDGGGGGGGSDDDGVFQYAAHSQYVCGLRWVGHGAGAKLLSASFDGSVRLLDLSRAAGPAAAAAAASAAASANGNTATATASASSAAGFELLRGIPDEAAGLEWSAVEAGGAAGDVVFLATAEGEMTAVDTRCGGGGNGGGIKSCLPLVAAHDKRVHSLSLEPGGGTLLASICTDGALKVFDVRKLIDGGTGRAAPCEQVEVGAAAAGAAASSPSRRASPRGGGGKGAAEEGEQWLPDAPLGEGRHGRSSHAAFWAPDGSRRLLSISFDDTLAVWRYDGGGGGGEGGGGGGAPDNAAPPVVAGARVISKKGKKQAPEGDHGSGLLRRALTLRHNNDTGRYVVPFKPFWAPRADGFFVGEMDPTPFHGMALYGAATGERRALLGREGLLTAIPARGCAGELPGGKGVVVACTSSGRAHVFR